MAAGGCIVVLTGCVLPPAQLEAPAPYYVASVDTSSTTTTSTEQGLRVLDPRAREVLQPGITVAFFPPDRCRNISAASTTATPEMVEMQNDCGVLVSALETSVADRYSVISWQTLKGEDPFARAAARNVSVIFEVDSLGMDWLAQDASFAGTISFYQQHGAADRVPLVLDGQDRVMLGERCRTWVDALDAHGGAADAVGSFTGAIKAVEVSTGQALVYYQRTLTDEPGSESRQGYDLYFRHDEPQKAPPPKPNALQKGGVGMIVVGVAAVVLGAALRATSFRGRDQDGDGVEEYRQPGTAATAGAVVAGSVFTVGGIPLLIFGNRKAKRSVPPPLPLLPSEGPREVLCVAPETPPWLVQPSDPAVGGSSYSFSETQSAGRDPRRERENRLRRVVIEDFNAALGALGGP